MKLTPHPAPGRAATTLGREGQISLLAWVSDALRPVLPALSGPLLFATWRLAPGQQFPMAGAAYEGTERGLIVRAGSSPFADYLLLLESGEWARALPVTIDLDDGKLLTYHVEPLKPAEVIDNGRHVDQVIDALIETFTVRCGDCAEPYDEPRDAPDDARRLEALSLLSRLAQLPGVVELRRRTQESRRRMLAHLGIAIAR